MLTRDTIRKKVEELKPGDIIISTISGYAASADRVNEVRFVKGGKVHVDVNCYTGTNIYNEGEEVRVSHGGEK